MNQGSSSTWYPDPSQNSMLASGDDELANLLQLELDFPSLDEPAARNGFENPFAEPDLHGIAMGGPAFQPFHGPGAPSHTSSPPLENLSLNNSHSKSLVSSNLISTTAPPFQQHYVPQPWQPSTRARQSHTFPTSYQNPPTGAPPTPQSSDLRGAVTFPHHSGADAWPELQTGQAVSSNRDDSMAFTPLASPAVPPVDPSLRADDSHPSCPPTYPSPLTSPAMEAHHGHPRRKRREDTTTTGQDSSTNPPMEKVNSHSNVANTSQTANKPGTRRPSHPTRQSHRSVRQSPLSRPQSGQRRTSVSVRQKRLVDPACSPGSDDYLAAQSLSLVGSEDVGLQSISPEPLSDALMPPPSLPRTVHRLPRNDGPSRRATVVSEPATPATLMRLPSQDPSTSADNSPLVMPYTGPGYMEDIVLPDSAAMSSHEFWKMDSRTSSVEAEKLANTSSKTPKLSASSTPSSSTIKSKLQSQTDGRHKRTESRTNPGHKARPAPTSSEASPAIRPKISPNIKPLISSANHAAPSASADSSALYLATKSNYQNILEGTHLPGVSYPGNLAENLSSKRTSHKLAEQGRRNRINVALKEMESLLPTVVPAKGKKDGPGSSEGDAADRSGNSNNSKASTVETAIAYIKALQAELSDTKMKLNERGKQMTEDGGSPAANGSMLAP